MILSTVTATSRIMKLLFSVKYWLYNSNINLNENKIKDES